MVLPVDHIGEGFMNMAAGWPFTVVLFSFFYFFTFSTGKSTFIWEESYLSREEPVDYDSLKARQVYFYGVFMGAALSVAPQEKKKCAS